MINIIDIYLSDKLARENKTPLAEARRPGGFLGAWLRTARKTFKHLYVFGTNDEVGSGSRETFVVVASNSPMDLTEFGRRAGDPQFYVSRTPFLRDPYGDDDLKALDLRSRGILLTDDYAPVDNLLAPVAETRGTDD